MLELLQRYESLLQAKPACSLNKTSNAHLCWMLREIAAMNWQETKAHRWLGFVQGVMACKGLIDVDEERELTRSLFQ